MTTSPTAVRIYGQWLDAASCDVSAIAPSPNVLQVARDVLGIDDAQHEADRIEAGRVADGDREAEQRLLDRYGWRPNHSSATSHLTGRIVDFFSRNRTTP